MSRGTPATRRLVLAAAGALLLPRAVDAQRAKRRRITFLNLGSRASAEVYFGVLQQRLRALGYLDEDIEVEIRGADGHLERLSDIAADLVRLGPEVVIGLGPAAVQAVRQATETIPIVMVDVADPVGLGFVTSLAHPGANVTGVANLAQETVGKRLQLLKTAIPDAERIAMLVNPGNRGNILQLQATREAAGTLHMELLSVEARAAGEIDAAFVMLARGSPDRGQRSCFLLGKDPDCRARGQAEAPGNLSVPRIFGHWRIDELRTRSERFLGARCFLCRQNSQWRQAGRSAGRAAEQVRAGGQSEDGTGAPPDDPAIDPRPAPTRSSNDRFSPRHFLARRQLRGDCVEKLSIARVRGR